VSSEWKAKVVNEHPTVFHISTERPKRKSLTRRVYVVYLFSVSTPSTKEAPSVKEREARIPVKVTADEKRKFEKLAASRYTTLSELIRQLLHRESDSKTARAGA
jgi:hypothetical protein